MPQAVALPTQAATAQGPHAVPALRRLKTPQVAPPPAHHATVHLPHFDALGFGGQPGGRVGNRWGGGAAIL